MLETKVPEHDSDDQTFPLQDQRFLRFQFPSRNFQYKIFSSKNELRFYIKKKSLELGLFQTKMMKLAPGQHPQGPEYLKMKCNYCNAYFTYVQHRDKRVRIVQFQNQHVHDITHHTSSFLKAFNFFLDKKFIDYVDSLHVNLGIGKMTQKVICNYFYSNFITFDQIIEKLKKQFLFFYHFRVWYNQKKKPCMITFITKTMKENFKMYGDAICIDGIDKYSEIKNSNYFGRFWKPFTITGLDSNNRVVIFAIGLIQKSKQNLDLSSQAIYELITQVLTVLLRKDQNSTSHRAKLQTIITDDSPAMQIAMQNLKSTFDQFDWAFVIGLNYKIQTLIQLMRKRGYSMPDIKKLVYFYFKMMTATSQDDFSSYIKKVLKISKEKRTLYEFISQREKYCFHAFDNKFCGFGMAISKLTQYGLLNRVLHFRHNLFRFILNILMQQSIFNKRSFQISYSTNFQKLSTDKVFMGFQLNLEKNLIITKKPQPTPRKVLESAIFKKIMFNYEWQKAQFIFKKNSSIEYDVFFNNHRHGGFVCKVMLLGRWFCSCTYSLKVGIPCAHLTGVLVREGSQSMESYFSLRWMKSPSFQSRFGPKHLALKKRRHS